MNLLFFIIIIVIYIYIFFLKKNMFKDIPLTSQRLGQLDPSQRVGRSARALVIWRRERPSWTRPSGGAYFVCLFVYSLLDLDYKLMAFSKVIYVFMTYYI